MMFMIFMDSSLRFLKAWKHGDKHTTRAPYIGLRIQGLDVVFRPAFLSQKRIHIQEG